MKGKSTNVNADLSLAITKFYSNLCRQVLSVHLSSFIAVDLQLSVIASNSTFRLITIINPHAVLGTNIATIIDLRTSHIVLFLRSMAPGVCMWWIVLERGLRRRITFAIIPDYYSFLDLGTIAPRLTANLNNYGRGSD